MSDSTSHPLLSVHPKGSLHSDTKWNRSVYASVHIRQIMETLKVGIREFREKLASYLLETEVPVPATIGQSSGSRARTRSRAIFSKSSYSISRFGQRTRISLVAASLLGPPTESSCIYVNLELVAPHLLLFGASVGFKAPTIKPS